MLEIDSSTYLLKKLDFPFNMVINLFFGANIKQCDISKSDVSILVRVKWSSMFYSNVD